jgi:alkylation response protein AidB-like acyl-CoA dehydrogenase
MSIAPPLEMRAHRQTREQIPNFLKTERALLEQFLPGLDAALKEIPLNVLEGRENPSIKMLREARGPALLIPKQFGGLGASAPEGLRVMRAVASRSPSLGIAYTMHNFSVSTMVEWAMSGEQSAEELGAFILSSLAENSMYLASGFAEGRSGAKPLEMTMKARRAPDGGWLITGRKKPCSLTYSMDFLTCGVSAETTGGVWSRGIGLVPADSEGIERKPFWKSNVMGGAESDEIILTDVHVPEDFVFVPETSAVLDPVEVTGYIWLQLALTSNYLGAVSNLVLRLLESGKGAPEERGLVAAQIEAQAAAVDGLAYALQAGENRDRLLTQALSVRFTAQGIIETVAMRCAELLGGIAFIGSTEVAYLLCACRALAFHPPSRMQATRALDEYARGGVLDVS